MSYKMMFTLNAIVALVFGAVFLLMPETILNYFEAEAYVATILMGRFFGSAMISLGLLLWFTKDMPDEAVQKWMAISMFASAVLGLIVTILDIASEKNIMRANGWIAIVVYFLFALGYGFLLYLKPKLKE